MGELIHRAVGTCQKVEEVELRIREVVSLEEQLAAARHGVLNQEQGDQEIVSGRVRFHANSLTQNDLISN